MKNHLFCEGNTYQAPGCIVTVWFLLYITNMGVIGLVLIKLWIFPERTNIWGV